MQSRCKENAYTIKSYFMQDHNIVSHASVEKTKDYSGQGIFRAL